MKTPDEVAAALYPTLTLPASPTGADLRAVMAAAVEADRRERDMPLIDSLSYVDESTDARVVAARIMAYLKGDPNWETVEVDDDDDYQECSSCGDSVHALSTDGLCDGCVAEREPVEMQADDLKPGYVFRHSYMRQDHRVTVERTYRYTPSRGILDGVPMLGVIYTEDHAAGKITGTMRIGRSETVWVDRDSINEE